MGARIVFNTVLDGTPVRRLNCSLVVLATSAAWIATVPASHASDEEPTREECEAAVGEARTIAAALPAGDISRYFAERHLHQAMAEAGNGEFDECVEAAERAAVELKERRHTLKPGESFKVLRADE